MIRTMKRILLPVLTVAVFAAGCRDVETEVKDGFVAVEDGALYYEEAGSGEPLLLLHGHSLDRRMWDGQFQEFARHYRVIRPDFRGYGCSTSQSETQRATHLDDLLTLMDSLGVDRAHIVGLSMGAFVAGDMLAVAPERMLSCVLVSGGIRNVKGPHSPMDSLESARRDVEIAEVRAKGVDAMKREWIEQLVSGGGSRREEIRAPLSVMIGEWDAWQSLHKEVRLFWGNEAFELLRERCPDVPTLIIRGEMELKGRPLEPRELPYLPRGRDMILRDCGHMANMEQPEAFNAAVLEFLIDNS